MFAEPARKSGRREAPLEQDMRIRPWTEEEFSANLAVHKTLLHMSSGRQLLTEVSREGYWVGGGERNANARALVPNPETAEQCARGEEGELNFMALREPKSSH